MSTSFSNVKIFAIYKVLILPSHQAQHSQFCRPWLAAKYKISTSKGAHSMSDHGYTQGCVLLAVSTKKGLFLLSSKDRQTWDIRGPLLRGHGIYNAVFDPRNHYRLFAADNEAFFGSFLRYSDDFGETWLEPEHGLQFPQESGQ